MILKTSSTMHAYRQNQYIFCNSLQCNGCFLPDWCNTFGMHMILCIYPRITGYKLKVKLYSFLSEDHFVSTTFNSKKICLFDDGRAVGIKGEVGAVKLV